MPTSRAPLPPTVEVAVMACCAAAVAGLAALAGPFALALALWVAGGVLAWGWAGMLALPAPRGTSVVLYAGSLALVFSALLADRTESLRWVPGALALSLVAAFVHQLLRVDGRPRIVESISAIALGLALITGGVLLIPLTGTQPGAALVVASLAAAAASSLTDVLGRWPAVRPWLVPLSLVAGGVTAAAVALALSQEWTVFVLAGVVAGAVSHALRSVHAPLPTMAHPRPRLVVAVCSLLVSGPVAYGVALALLPGYSLG